MSWWMPRFDSYFMDFGEHFCEILRLFQKFKAICLKIIEEYGLLSVQRPLKDIVADVFVDMPAVLAGESDCEWIHRWVNNQSKDPLKSGSRKLALVNVMSNFDFILKIHPLSGIPRNTDGQIWQSQAYGE